MAGLILDLRLAKLLVRVTYGGANIGPPLNLNFFSCKFLLDNVYFNLFFLFWRNFKCESFRVAIFLSGEPVVSGVSLTFPAAALAILTTCKSHLFFKLVLLLAILSKSFSTLSTINFIQGSISPWNMRLAPSISDSGTNPNTRRVWRTFWIRGISLVVEVRVLRDSSRRVTDSESVRILSWSFVIVLWTKSCEWSEQDLVIIKQIRLS